MDSRKPIILVLCTGNSCRSQMAEGFLKKHLGDRYEVHSAGTDPKDQVHPLAARVMAEAGVDISSHTPKPLSKFLGRESVRHLVIVCDHANGTCPRIWPGSLTRDYIPFEDPAHFEGTAEETLGKFREVRDQIDRKFRGWEPAVGTPATQVTRARA